MAVICQASWLQGRAPRDPQRARSGLKMRWSRRPTCWVPTTRTEPAGGDVCRHPTRGQALGFSVISCTWLDREQGLAQSDQKMSRLVLDEDERSTHHPFHVCRRHRQSIPQSNLFESSWTANQRPPPLSSAHSSSNGIPLPEKVISPQPKKPSAPTRPSLATQALRNVPSLPAGLSACAPHLHPSPVPSPRPPAFSKTSTANQTPLPRPETAQA